MCSLRARNLSSEELASRLVAFVSNEKYNCARFSAARYSAQAGLPGGSGACLPAANYAVGQVTGTRPGNNPEHGPFTVIQVRFEDGELREFASALQTPHSLNIDFSTDTQAPVTETDVKAILGVRR